MNNDARKRTPTGLVALLPTLFVALAIVPAAIAAEPVEQVRLISRFGGQVNATEAGKGATLEDICTVASEDTCQGATAGTAAGSFNFPRGITVQQGPEADIYVSDAANKRVEKFNPAGEFVLMFGAEVNATKDAEAGATEAEKNVCTAVSNDICKDGTEGSGGGQFTFPTGIAVEQSSGDVYVVDQNNHRVQKFSAEGQFILTFGGEVNATTNGDVCLAGEACRAGVPGAGKGEFEPMFAANIIAVGGAGGLVYVGDTERVEAFEPSGTWKADISLSSLGSGKVSALAIDPDGNIYVKDTAATGVREFKAEGAEGTSFSELAGQFDAGSETINAVTVAPSGDIVVVDGNGGSHGIVYKPSGEVRVSSFGMGVLSSTTGIAYDDAHNVLYTTGFGAPEVQVLKGPAVFAEAFTGPVASLQTTGATLIGLIVPNAPDISETTWLLRYGTTTALGEKTAEIVLGSQGEGELFEGFWEVTPSLAGLEPHKTYHYRFVARNKNGSSPSENEEEFTTLAINPQLEASAQPASNVTFADATLPGTVNPENLATQYRFEYGPCLPSPICSEDEYGSNTPTLASGETFGGISFFQVVAELRPLQAYHYRLVADNEQEVRQENGEPVIEGGTTVGPEGTFTTHAPPQIAAVSGDATGITQSAAVLSGTVRPNGLPATYGFQIGTAAGIYGPTTGFGSVAAGADEAAVTSGLENLQPGTTYHYRLVAIDAYETAYGADRAFTTPGVPSVLTQPVAPMLIATPTIAFPTARGITTPGKKATPTCRAKAKKIKNSARRRKALRRCVKTKSKKNGRRRTN